MDWFLYDNGLRHERVKLSLQLVMSKIHRKYVSALFEKWGPREIDETFFVFNLTSLPSAGRYTQASDIII